MSTKTELNELNQALGTLRRCVHSLQSRYGDLAAVRRIVNDVERLDIDASELDLTPHEYRNPENEKIQIPDTEYDREFWGDIDDEGVGGYR